MPTVNKATNAFPKFGLSRPCVGMFAQQQKSLVEPPKIGVCDIIAKFPITVEANADQICLRSCKKTEPSHALRDTER